MRSLILVSLAMVTISALSVVWLRHEHRLSYVALQRAQEQRDQLNIEWGQLLLEQSTWAIPHRVEVEAGKRLGMFVPQPDKIIVLKAQ